VEKKKGIHKRSNKRVENPVNERLHQGILHPILMYEGITLESYFPPINRFRLLIENEVVALFPNIPSSTIEDLHEARSRKSCLG
jgi:hypothetical protein